MKLSLQNTLNSALRRRPSDEGGMPQPPQGFAYLTTIIEQVETFVTCDINEVETFIIVPAQED